MDAALHEAGGAYMAARRVRQDAMVRVVEAGDELRAAEFKLIEAIHNDSSDDGGSAFICDGYVVMLVEEYWEKPPGEKLEVHRLMGVQQ